jgi:hypothetical protein
VATGRKPLWPRASGPLLILGHYSGSTVATSVLWWFVVVMGADVTLLVSALTSSSDGQLTSDSLSLLVFTAAMGG